MSAYTESMELIRAGEILSATDLAEKILRSRTCAAKVLREAYSNKDVQVVGWGMYMRGQYPIYGAYKDGVDAEKPVVVKEERAALARKHYLKGAAKEKPVAVGGGGVLFDLYIYPQLMKPRY